MSNQYDPQNIIAVSNKKALEWSMAQKRIEEIFAKFSKYSECPPEHIKIELENELQRMWADLETYKIELEMQNDELLRAFRDAEDVRKDYVELFNSAPVGYLILNSSAIILNANQTFANMVKTDLAQIYQKPFQNFVAQNDVSDFLSRFKSYFKNPSDKFFELTINDSKRDSIVVRLEGRKKNISGFANRSPAGERNTSVGYDRTERQNDIDQEVLLISLSDITLLKQAEEEKESLKNLLLHARKMEAIGTLAAGIAHDFNNILFPILGFGEMLKDELKQIQDMNRFTNVQDKNSLTKSEQIELVAKPNDMEEMVDSIITNTLRAKGLVKQILAFSKNSSTAVSPLYLNLILTEIIISLRPLLLSDIKIVEIIDNSCSMIIADAQQIRQVIVNLINNAVDAMQDGGGTITISLKEDNFKETCHDTGALLNGRYVCLSIKDTGHGIEKEHLPRIFDPYFSTRPKFKGGGLGLSLVHGIVSSYNGAITVRSEPGEGSEFRLFFPCHTSVSDLQQGLIKRKLPLGSEKILVIDDQVSITKVLESMLKRLGYTVFKYNNPKSALNFFKDRPADVDLILSDMTMPEMSGDDVAREAMAIQPDIPIIILTGYSEKLSSEEAEEMGIKGYLMKPVSLTTLAESVREALDGD
ncbi:MAG: response regulator [Desulfamplus sp.]|nr:response regulator [Desulfamplus sp.]